MDCNGCEDSQGACKTEGRCSENIEVVEADGGCRNCDGFKERNFAQYARLMLTCDWEAAAFGLFVVQRFGQEDA